MTPFNLYENFYANTEQKQKHKEMVEPVYKPWKFLSAKRNLLCFFRWHATVADIKLLSPTQTTNDGRNIGICLYNYDKNVTTTRSRRVWAFGSITNVSPQQVRNCQYSNYIFRAPFTNWNFPVCVNENEKCPKYDMQERRSSLSPIYFCIPNYLDVVCETTRTRSTWPTFPRFTPFM